MDEIISEIERLTKRGFKEIVLTGICLGAYGRDLKPKTSLIDLLEGLEKIAGLLRIRLSSIEAADINDELIEKIGSSGKFCRHLHIPLQSGDDLILRKMRRKYSAKNFLMLIRKIKRRIPDIAITTDVLAGFPGEDRNNFMNTARLIKKIAPLKVHIFPYSPREGTPAYSLVDKALDTKIIRQRTEYLKEIADTCAAEFRKKFLRRKMQILVEGKAKNNSPLWQGYTDNYIKVLLKVKAGSKVRNRILALRIKKIYTDYALGECSL